MNYSVQAFTPADREKFSRRLRRAWITMLGVFAFIGLFLLILLAMDDYRHAHHILFLIFGIVFFILSALATPNFLRMYKDKREQQKICGEFPTAKKAFEGEEAKSYTLNLRAGDKVHEIRLSPALYYLLVPTKPVYVEISVHSSTLLRLSQQGQEIPV